MLFPWGWCESNVGENPAKTDLILLGLDYCLPEKLDSQRSRDLRAALVESFRAMLAKLVGFAYERVREGLVNLLWDASRTLLLAKLMKAI